MFIAWKIWVWGGSIHACQLLPCHHQSSFNTLQEKMTPLNSGSDNPEEIVDLLRKLFFFSFRDDHVA